MTNWIQNVSLEEIKSGKHMDAGDRAVLIQITDCGGAFPKPKAKFEKVFQFEFHDHEIPTDEWAPQKHHAEAIVKILQDALEERRNVIVHCHAGLCRSGAVTEAGVIMGFTDTEKLRLPNLLLKKYLMEVLNLTYDHNEEIKARSGQELWH